MDDPPYLAFFCAFSVLAWSFELYLSLRQRKRLLKSEGPHPLTGLSKEEFEASRKYSLDKNSFNILSEAVNTTASIFFFLMNGMSWMWKVSEGAGALIQLQDEISVSLIFLAVFYIKSSLETVPWDLYETFVIEEQNGFNKQTFSLWIRDQAVTHVLVFVIGGPVAALALIIIKWAGPSFYLYIWLFTTAVLFFMITIYPHAIAPLFNTFTKLADGPLKTKIEALAQKNSFPLKELFVVDGSIRSSHSNAYFYGFGRNKRIVLYDTLSSTLQKPSDQAPKEANGCTDEEIVAILAHELGHWRKKHTVLQLGVAEVHLFFFFFSFGFMIANPGMYRSFGFDDKQPVMVGLLLFSCVVSPVEHLLGFAQNSLTRLFEYQADRFATEQGMGQLLQQGLCKISKDNKSNPDPDPWYSAYHHTHPSLLERLRAVSADPSFKPKAA